MVYLAIDPGLAQIGVAISHEGKLAEPLTTFPARNASHSDAGGLAHQLIDHVKKLVDEHHPDVIVIGEPHVGPIKDLSVVLHDEIKRVFSGRVVLHPEDLSSQEAVKKMVEGGVPKEKRKEEEHAAAATLILQDYLDSKPSL
ncbi:hypothetical protein A3A84_03320 [Candidatus Collierbacteria bacterium RIFCSPLOWO2_01_FULL_50_23]|uniref:Putative pre-16S rRNA nuclease n=2 Tax=Candidatus Collieribacteriota TaxID=1752725 RepID=A0A1F5EX18_9BACT|nr:MAG: hypothetical protein A3D09_00280 [Candidatus Collierbacteria bacterium RIFCSPHIGHO2_02_FULL_49_10]OGD72142.1 MAG: hypothetical protein A2703_02895 [Candidatus Collierbacteria bacterium RIFCSPHIGHO2_01_FULL_50_25]OGD75075.1 MAG: hypothetical protein A3A84_03320 [Candidatus Collierbacteria bacterium RIFCSPLOWO2_01_FULL_50_23]